MTSKTATDKPQGNASIFSTTPGLLTACLGACLLWGSAFPCIKIGYGLFGIDASDVASIIAFAGARFLISGALVIVTMTLARRRPYVPARADWPCAAKLSVFQTSLQYLLFYVGLSRSEGVTSSIIEASNTFFIVLLAVYAFRTERMTARKALGCIVGFAGVLLVNLGGSASGSMNFSLDGEGLVFLSTLSAAVSSNLSKRYSREHDPVLISGWQFVIGGATLLVAGLAMGGRVAPADAANPLPALALLTYMGFISAAAYSLWSMALAANPVSRVAVFGFMNPVFGVVLSALLLGETSVVNPVLAVAALVLVSIGIIVVNREGDNNAGAKAA